MSRIVRVADQRRMPWKNGGGETVEIATSPAGAGLDAFDWRVSMARVASDGPFSPFAGIARTICVVDGDGMMLTVAGAEPLAMTVGSPPHAFAGDVATSARLIGGPIVDLNVMTRRERWTHRLARIRIAGDGITLEPDATTRIVIPNDHGGIVASDGRAREVLARHDALIATPGDRWILEPAGADAEVFVVELAPR